MTDLYANVMSAARLSKAIRGPVPECGVPVVGVKGLSLVTLVKPKGKIKKKAPSVSRA